MTTTLNKNKKAPMNGLRRMDIKFLRGIGPKRAELLEKNLGIKTYHDLLFHFPTHYIDRRSIYRIIDFAGEDMPSLQVKGKFISFTVQGEGAKTRLVGLFSDGSAVMEVVWFQRIKTLRQLYHTATEYILFGKPSNFNGRWSMVHPEVDTPEAASAQGGFRGVYPLTEQLRNRGFSSKTFSTAVSDILSGIREMAETLPPEIISRHRLIGIREAISAIHSPQSPAQLEQARLRLKFEELFYLQLDIQRYARKRNSAIQGFHFPRIGHFFNTFYSEFLPFPLTNAQKRVIKEIRADMATGRQMNRLLQGDVGSGKTLVALLCMLIALDNNTQACLMAPTEILATQHFETITKLVSAMGINVRLLTGSTRKKERAVIHEQLSDGSLHILIGTHAVIEDNVRFHNLGFIVIDEQHRFGVAQRARLWTKNVIAPHVLVMTATPIPRTLAMTVYGDLDVSVIDELPPGRKPVVTLLRYEEDRFKTYQGIGRQLRLGRQVYIVYPLIKENEKLDLKSLEDGYENICETFRDYKVAFVHGQMKPQEKEYQMNLFASHEAHILVATTVIEVGVNVPNATTMLIENAERFGLSQLHQLRGRVGRGEGQSYCILMSKRKIAKDTRKRLELMTSTTDGFAIAEADMQMRGPGDIEGTMQSGIPIDLHIADLATDGQIVQLARDTACTILDSDPDLQSPANALIRSQLNLLTTRIRDWSRIS
ncbi:MULTISPECIES: ATP-dependent DNA helicase RecG [Duncaniella]|uniref:ATP-dependent DNA helicase RecG n=2 Tax=Muribaculaceae TaxID=2005473 RepID=UPI0023F1CD1C|nr:MULTISPECIES: ATP-dependent DNA helicase RecG [Duncaniella]MCX4285506.1 ATP-dependent DNA helicase RecG [Duncaniella dubosii]